MTKEQMEEIRAKVIEALRGVDVFDEVDGLDFADGDPLPIMFNVGSDSLVLELSVA